VRQSITFERRREATMYEGECGDESETCARKHCRRSALRTFRDGSFVLERLRAGRASLRFTSARSGITLWGTLPRRLRRGNLPTLVVITLRR
jgi:hypothetical protein